MWKVYLQQRSDDEEEVHDELIQVQVVDHLWEVLDESTVLHLLHLGSNEVKIKAKNYGAEYVPLLVITLLFIIIENVNQINES